MARSYRRLATGADGSADPFGDHGIASFSWSVDRSVDTGNAVASLRLRHRKAGATDWVEESASASGASGTCSKLVAAGTGSAYEVQCEVTDSHGLSSTATAVIPVATAPIDVGSYGASVGIGVAAPESPGVAIGSPVSFADPAASRRALGIATVADVAWTDLWKDTSGNYVRWACRNNVVYVTWKIPQASAPPWRAGILPAGYRPSNGSVAVAAWTEGNRMATAWVDGSGGVLFQVNSAQTNGTNQGSLSYPIF